MNPSASGWLKKHIFHLENETQVFQVNMTDFYEKLQDIGFVYANSIATISYPENQKWTIEELTKINLIDALFFVGLQHHPTLSFNQISIQILDFYQMLEDKSKWKFNFIQLKNTPEQKLEAILHQRIQTNVSKVKKQFSHIITNALIFIDVLAFESFLKNHDNPVKTIKKIEAQIISLVFNTVAAKEKPGQYDVLIMNLLQNSLRYYSLKKPIKHIDYQNITSLLLKRYYLDLIAVTLYNDKKIDSQEYKFLFESGKKLKIEKDLIKHTLKKMQMFFETHQNHIAYFKYSNALGHFYNNTQRMVKLLILRNKSRLLQELSESKELVFLLAKSSYQNLDKEERKKVKTQLLDICKSIPSLGIFILPGGSILLPILIKFIPQLLPSAFDENKIEKS